MTVTTNEKKTTPFSFVDAASSTKQNIFTEETAKEYIPFIVNRAFSYHIDSLFFANEMNRYHELEKDIQFHFYLSTLRPKKRFAKWVKKLEVKDLELVQQALGCNAKRAAEVLERLSPSDLDELRLEQDRGGVQSGSVQ